MAPFKPYVGQNAFDSGYFKGTVFRFPLRNRASALSENLYNKQKIEELFENFKSEADNILLFLNHVSSISLAVKHGWFKVESKITRAESCKKSFLSALKKHSEVVEKGGKSQLILQRDSKEAVWSLRITTTSNKSSSKGKVFWSNFTVFKPLELLMTMTSN